jgi:predicted PurR-regulated permease PerM
MEPKTSGRFIQLQAFRIVLMIFALSVAIYLCIQLRSLIISTLFAVTLAAAIAPVAEWGEQNRISRRIMVALLYVGVALLYAAVALLLAPTVKEQAVNLYQNIPDYISHITDWVEWVKNVAPNVVADQAKAIKIDREMVQNIAMKIGNETLDLSANLLSLVLNGLLVLFLTAYFVVEAHDICNKLLLWIPKDKRDRCRELLPPLTSRMGGYVRGQILVSIVVGAFLATGLSLIQIKYSLILGLLAGLLNLVPFVGSMSACVFALVVAFNQSLWLGGATLLLFGLEQWVESNFIVPHLLGGQVELHPLVVFFAIVIGASLMGLPGALVAVPVASAIVFLAQEFYLKPLNEEPEPIQDKSSAAMSDVQG